MTDTDSVSRLLPDNCTPCRARLDAKRPWDRVLAVRFGDGVAGVRCDTAATAAVVEEHFHPIRVPEHDRDVAPNFSLEADPQAGLRRLFLVYRDHEVVARREGWTDLLLDLVDLLDEPSKLVATATLNIYASLVTGNESGAMVLPGWTHSLLLSRRRQLAKGGLTLAASRVHRLDVVRGSVSDDLADPDLARMSRQLGGRQVCLARSVNTWGVAAGAGVVGRATLVMTLADAVLGRGAHDMGRVLRGLEIMSRSAAVWTMPEAPDQQSGASSRLATALAAQARSTSSRCMSG